MPARRTRDDTEDLDSTEETPFQKTFHSAVYSTVRKIPEGKVASYGTIARLVGYPRHSRMVGSALKVLPSSLSSPYLPPAPRSTTSTTSTSTSASSTNDPQEEEDYVEPAPTVNPDLVPWWRVVSSTGVISPRGNERAVRRQADYLQAEGVVVRDGVREGAAGGGRGREEGGIAARGNVDAFGLGGVNGGRVSMVTYGWKG